MTRFIYLHINYCQYIPTNDIYGFAPGDFVVPLTGLPDPPGWSLWCDSVNKFPLPFMVILHFLRRTRSARLIHQPTPFPLESVPNLSLSLCHSLYQKGHSSVSTRCISSLKEMTPNSLPDLAGGVPYGMVGREYLQKDADHLQLFFGCVQAGQRG